MFSGEKVFVNVLKVMKRKHIGKLLENIHLGTQILFEHHLEEWRNSLEIPFNDTLQDFNLLNFSKGPLSPVPSSSSSISNQSRYVPYTRPSTPDEGVLINLSTILNENTKGKMLALYYDTNKRFLDEHRTMLVNLISQHFEEKGIPMTLATSYRLEKEITERFQNEKLVGFTFT